MSIHRQEKQHERSELLSEQENNAIINGLGRNCQALSTAVVQLYLAETPNKQRWNKRCCGVVCFVKDNPKRSYYIRVYDPKGENLLWEQEIYNQFTYNSPREYFHTFEADDCQAALNFASEDEANKFKGVVENKLLERVKKRRERKKHGGQPLVANSNQNITNMGMINVGSGAPPAADVTLNKPAGVLPPKINKDKGKDKGRKRLTKDDIGTPTDFRHVDHVGWDPSTGLDMQKLNPEMKALFEKVGIQTDVNKETVDFIYDFVDKHGGFEALKEDLARNQGPSIPALPPGLSTRPPPPPFSRSTTPGRSGAAPPPTPPHRGGPLPHPPGRPGVTAPPPQLMRKGAPPPPGRPAASAPPPPPGHQGGKIPLPPPPPPGGPFMSRPPQGAAPPMAPAGGNRSGLLADIHRGKDLIHVEQESRNSLDARDGLLNQIRSGKTLRPVTQSEPAPAPEPQGIVGALALALAKRSGAIYGSEDEDDGDDDMDADDDDEWDD